MDLRFSDEDEAFRREIAGWLETQLSGPFAAVRGRGDSALKLLGVTVLTNLDRADLSEQGIDMPPLALVQERARLSQGAGFDGIVASGKEAAIRQALEAVRPGGVLVQMGLGGEATLPLNTLVAKELELRGTFRFHHEFRVAAETIASGRIDVTPLLTDVIPLDRAVEAFELASDRRRAMKVQLAFGRV